MGVGIVTVVIAAAALIVFLKPRVRVEDVLAAYQDGGQYSGLTILYPFDEALFPPEIVPPVFRWKDDKPESDTWLVTIKFRDNNERMNFLAHEQKWKPKAKDWEAIKKRSLEKEAEVNIVGVNRSAPKEILSGGRISICTSKHEVGAPLFYR
jgi:hypothetical protein